MSAPRAHRQLGFHGTRSQLEARAGVCFDLVVSSEPASTRALRLLVSVTAVSATQIGKVRTILISGACSVSLSTASEVREQAPSPALRARPATARDVLQNANQSGRESRAPTESRSNSPLRTPLGAAAVQIVLSTILQSPSRAAETSGPTSSGQKAQVLQRRVAGHRPSVDRAHRRRRERSLRWPAKLRSADSVLG